MTERLRTGMGTVVVAVAGYALLRFATSSAAHSVEAVKPVRLPPPPAPEATWPWPKVVVSHPWKGVTRWFDDATEDGTKLELFQFDFHENPHLRFELYDQDEDDAHPFDNRTDYFERGVGQVARDLDAKGRGKVVAAWNGLFFAYDRGPGSPPNGYATHIGPVVLRGKAYDNVGQHRWTFGVRYIDGKPSFRTLLKPDKATLEREFDFASTGAQCLIRQGVPLRLPDFSADGVEPRPETTPDDAGVIPGVDFLQTSRTSMGWSKDGRYLYLLVVDEPDSETASKIAFRRGQPASGGWSLIDLQRFWLRFGAWGAVNSDGGSVTQLVWLREDGKYELLPAKSASPGARLTFGPELSNLPQGGTLLTFYVSDRKR